MAMVKRAKGKIEKKISKKEAKAAVDKKKKES